MTVYNGVPFTLTASATNPFGAPVLTYVWTQISGPGTSSLLNDKTATVTINALTSGTYVFQCAVGDGLVTNNQQTTVIVTPLYTSTQSFTANCGVGTIGNSVTRTATVTSIVSQNDADTNALAAATAAANAAIRCDPSQGFVGWRIVVPNLSNFMSGTNSAQYQIQLRVAMLTSGTAAAPTSISYLATTTLIAGASNIVDLSSYFAANSGTRTFYVWPQLSLTLNGVTTITQLPSNAISLDYVSPVGGASAQTIRFRDVETAATNYQGYASAFALTVNNTSFAAVQLTLNLGNNWDTFSLNTHGWDDLTFGNKPNRGYNKLVLAALEGTPSAPLRQTILSVFQPTYNYNDPYDFANNRLSFTPYFNGAQGTAYYVLRRARTLTGDALQFDPNETGFRFESSLNFYDYTTPGLTLPGASIGNLAENDAAYIIPGNNIVSTFTPFPGNPAIAAFPVPRFVLSSFKWKQLTDPYTHVVVVTISGTPGSPTGILNQYSFALGDPAVLDGPGNLLLNLQEFDTVSSPTAFTPFTAVFFSAVYNPTPNTFTLYASSFPILNNPRSVNGNPSFTVGTFAGYTNFPVAANGAITFSGNFSFSETIYNARVNNGANFTL